MDFFDGNTPHSTCFGTHRYCQTSAAESAKKSSAFFQNYMNFDDKCEGVKELNKM